LHADEKKNNRIELPAWGGRKKEGSERKKKTGPSPHCGRKKRQCSTSGEREHRQTKPPPRKESFSKKEGNNQPPKAQKVIRNAQKKSFLSQQIGRKKTPVPGRKKRERGTLEKLGGKVRPNDPS